MKRAFTLPAGIKTAADLVRWSASRAPVSVSAAEVAAVRNYRDPYGEAYRNRDLPLQVPVPVRTAGARWWPDLFLKKGRILQAVTPAEASAVAAEIRTRLMNEGQGASAYNPVKLYTEEGFRAGHVSWNGSVWIRDEESGNETEIPT